MFYTVYSNNTRWLITDSRDDTVKKEYGAAVVLELPRRDEVEKLVLHSTDQTVILYDPDISRIWGLLQEFLHTIQAAGGLVINLLGELLLIYRRGKWDLPKGKLDKGEDLKACALREVQEETGLSDLALKKPLLVTYHTYSEKGELILKESHWYLMHHNGQEKLVPQTDEDIEKCEWVAADRLDPYLNNSHPSITEVIRKGLEELTR